MALVDEEERRRAERAHQIALFRYQLIREAADPALSPRQRGAMVRELAAKTHTDPFGRQITIGRGTLDRWLRNWREGGDRITDKELRDHSRIEKLLKQLEKTNADDPEMSPLLQQLMEEVAAHVEDEENNLFRCCARPVGRGSGPAGRHARRDPALPHRHGRAAAPPPGPQWDHPAGLGHRMRA
ncbi:hemerythrin domain-containing protein, partial [Streptomyces sp. NPDC001156]